MRYELRRILATIAVMALLAAITAVPAGATPVYGTCHGLDGYVGSYEWAVDEYGNYTDAIYIDECALEDLGAGPYDYDRVLEHELGHADGLDHSSDSFDTMYPVIMMEGT